MAKTKRPAKNKPPAKKTLHRLIERPAAIEPLGLRPKKTAVVLDVCERTVWSLIKSGKLEVVHPSENTTLVTMRSIRRLVGGE